MARQGYWTEGKKWNSSSLFPYILPYVLGTLGALAAFLLVPEWINELLSVNLTLLPISYGQLLGLALFGTLVLGVSLENYYLVKNRTADTMAIFFGLRGWRFQQILLVKNLILALPFLVMGYFFFPRVLIPLFFLTHVLSYFGSRELTGFSFRKPAVSLAMNYLLSLLDMSSCLRLAIRPAIQLVIFLVVYAYYPQFLFLEGVAPTAVGLFLGLFAFSGKGLAYYAFALIKDLPYLKVIGMNLTKWLTELLVLTLGLPLVLLVPVSLLASLLYPWTLVERLAFCVGLWTAYLAYQGYHLQESLYFRDKDLPDVRAVEAWTFSWSERWQFWRQSWGLLLIYPGAILLRNHLTAYALLVSGLLVASFMVNARSFVTLLAGHEEKI